jgi:hypothetical protein
VADVVIELSFILEQLGHICDMRSVPVADVSKFKDAFALSNRRAGLKRNTMPPQQL